MPIYEKRKAQLQELVDLVKQDERHREVAARRQQR